MQGLPRSRPRTATQSLMSFTGTIAGLCILGAIIYYGVGWTRAYMGNYAGLIVGSALTLSYILLVKLASRQPDLPEDSEETLSHTPEPGPTLKRGLYFLLPLVVLLWCLIVERFSPGLSAFWATMVMVIITLTHKALLAYFRKQASTEVYKGGFADMVDGPDRRCP